MITAASPYIEALDKMLNDVEGEAYKIIYSLEQEIISLNQNKQLFEKGINKKGVRLEPYSPFTIALKKQKGEVFDRTTLLDTGDFYENFYVYARDGKFGVFSSDAKTPLLTKKYGKDIFGLTTDNEGKINDKVLQQLIEWIFKRLPPV
ncbi:hypothetical protein [Spongiimicrobium salis]|uniref:hypothetical protein n=1 Tax=Spongiimicrobium salis TaxID=1667022 RepID=UPI00374D4A76